MEKEILSGFTARISQANRSELIVIMYDMILYGIDSAKGALQNNNLAAFEKELERTQKVIGELIAVLDFSYPISQELFRLYEYMNGRVIQSKIKKQDIELMTVYSIAEKLKKSFEEVAKQDTSPSLMANTQQVYAGLTYGRGNLNEVYISKDEQSRGFKA